MHVSKSRFLPKQDTEPLLGLEEEKMFYQQHENGFHASPNYYSEQSSAGTAARCHRENPTMKFEYPYPDIHKALKKNVLM